MKKVSLLTLLIFTIVFTFENIQAHVQLDYPVGGETFSSGESINIQWTLLIAHDQDNWDLYFSTDGGTSWEAIELDIENARLNHRWTVPTLDTEMARIKIVQDNPGADYIGVSGDFTIQTASALEDRQGVYPQISVLHQNYPNPFNPLTAIGYRLSAVSDVELSIYNSLGQKVVTLVSKQLNAGSHQVEWDASDFASGVYYYRLEAGKFVGVKRMVLMR